MKFNTKVVHAGIRPDPTTGSIVPPIYQTATYVLDEVGRDKGFDYTRSSNPTRQVLEENLAALDSGRYGVMFASGMAAVDSALKLLEAGDHVVCSDDVYGGVSRHFNNVLASHGLGFTYVDTAQPETGAPGDPTGDEDALGRDPLESAAEDHRRRGDVGDREGGGDLSRSRLDLRDPRVPASPGTRRGYRHAQHDEVSERPQSDHRRGARHRSRGHLRSVQVHSEDDRRGAEPLRLLVDPAGGEDPASAHAAAFGECTGGGRVPRGARQDRAASPTRASPRILGTRSPARRCRASAG